MGAKHPLVSERTQMSGCQGASAADLVFSFIVNMLLLLLTI
jgi:hypothetical protein